MHHKWTHVDTYIAQIRLEWEIDISRYIYYASKQKEMIVSCGRSKGGGLIICKFCPLVKAFKINADVMLRSH